MLQFSSLGYAASRSFEGVVGILPSVSNGVAIPKTKTLFLLAGNVGPTIRRLSTRRLIQRPLPRFVFREVWGRINTLPLGNGGDSEEPRTLQMLLSRTLIGRQRAVANELN